ncbi:hypothetical protein [Clostridium tagluense]|uniref:Uncharacterized protein n=1 Tax=Clostridium tagluense TaxID=360422 RepID=A0A401UM41_9CLOT|nr:hypothetical protein [Clostridium tagluense]GCD10602.1 hypothetical protein Ctaglu_22250 [Clostridium tagluense]
MKTTSNYGLKKPEGTDIVDIADINSNMDIVDLKLKEIDNKSSNITVPVTKVNGKTGDVVLSATDIKTGDGGTVASSLTETVRQIATKSKTDHTHSGTYEPVLPIERKRKITSGTAIPTGGADGDIYMQYE